MEVSLCPLVLDLLKWLLSKMAILQLNFILFFLIRTKSQGRKSDEWSRWWAKVALMWPENSFSVYSNTRWNAGTSHSSDWLLWMFSLTRSGMLASPSPFTLSDPLDVWIKLLVYSQSNSSPYTLPSSWETVDFHWKRFGRSWWASFHHQRWASTWHFSHFEAEVA